MTNRRPLPTAVTKVVVALATAALCVISAAPTVSAAPFAYIANSGSNTVSVIDGATNTVVATLPVGAVPGGVAVNGTHVYVANHEDSTVSVIKTTIGSDGRPSFSVEPGAIPVGALPSAVAVSADGTRAYVAAGDGTISVIDTATNMVVRVFSIGGALTAVAINQAGTRLYATDAWSESLIVLDPNAPAGSNGVITAVYIGRELQGVAVNPSGTRVYVAAVQPSQDGGLWVVNTEPNTPGENTVVAGPITVGLGPMGVAVSPSGAFVYVANGGERSVSVVYAKTNTVVETVAVGLSPIGVATDASGARIFVANQGNPFSRPAVPPSVSVIDGATHQVTATITAGLGLLPSPFGAFVGGMPHSAPAPPSGDITELQRQLDAANARVRALEAEKTTLLQRIATLEKDLDTAKTQNAQLTTQVSTLTTQVTTLTTQVAMFTQQVQALQDEIARLKAEQAPLVAENTRLKAELDAANLMITSFVRRLMYGRTDANVAMVARDAAQKQLDLAIAKVGTRDGRVRHAQKEMKSGLAHLAAGHFSRSVRDFVEVCEIAHRILR